MFSFIIPPKDELNIPEFCCVSTSLGHSISLKLVSPSFPKMFHCFCQEEILYCEGVRQWNRLPIPGSTASQVGWSFVLAALMEGAGPWQEVWNWMVCKVPSSPNLSMVLWYGYCLDIEGYLSGDWFAREIVLVGGSCPLPAALSFLLQLPIGTGSSHPPVCAGAAGLVWAACPPALWSDNVLALL